MPWHGMGPGGKGDWRLPWLINSKFGKGASEIKSGKRQENNVKREEREGATENGRKMVVAKRILRQAQPAADFAVTRTLAKRFRRILC